MHLQSRVLCLNSHKQFHIVHNCDTTKQVLNNTLLTSESFHGIREVAQREWVLVSSPEDLSFIPEAHMMRKITHS